MEAAALILEEPVQPLQVITPWVPLTATTIPNYTWTVSPSTWADTSTITTSTGGSYNWTAPVTGTYATTSTGIYRISGNSVLDDSTAYMVNAGSQSYTINVTHPGTYKISYAVETPLSKAQQKVFEMRRRMMPVRRNRRALELQKSPQELKARESLRDIISEADYRRYITNGFIMVKGQSGKFYQVFSDQRRTVVYEKNKKYAELCIHSDRECPPTDHVINLKLLIEFDEVQVWAGANATYLDPKGGRWSYQGVG